MRLLSPLVECVQRKKGFFIFLVFASVAVAVFAVFSAINFDGGILDFNLSNVPYISYLRGDGGLAYLIFGMIFSAALFYVAILLCCCKSWLLPLALIFYLYRVYSHIMIFTCIILFYGFLNVLILLIFLLAFVLAELFMFILIICSLNTFTNSTNYFRSCFNKKDSCLMLATTLLVCVIVIFCLLLILLKSFVLLLVF